MLQHNIYGYIHGYPYPRQACTMLSMCINHSRCCRLERRQQQVQ